MIDIGNIQQTVLQRIKKISPQQILLILSFKKDRLLAITWEQEPQLGYKIYQLGFSKKLYSSLSPQNLKKILKQSSRHEFPRSNKLHLVTISTDEFQRRYPESKELESLHS